jgi:hypothetical protein
MRFELLSRLAVGDGSPTALDLATAEAEVRRTAALLKAAEANVNRAERSLINDETALAEVFADVLAEAFAGLCRVGIVEPGVGRVIAAESVAIQMPDPRPETTGKPWTVSARYVVAHRLD